MRSLWCILPAMLLSACTGDSDVVRVGSFLYGSITGRVEKVARERAEAIPYASMGLELGRTPQALLVLGATTETQLEWYGGEDVFVATRQGRIVRTLGLPYDLGGLDPLPARQAAATPGAAAASTAYALDFPDLGVFGASAQCSTRALGNDDIEILGATISTRHTLEHCEVPVMRWSFDNEFWADPASGYVWRSRQYIHPESPPVTLEVLRPEQSG